MTSFFSKNKGLLCWLLTSSAVLALFFLLRGNKNAMNALVYGVTLPLEQFMGRACAALPFSVSELLYALALLLSLLLLALFLRSFVRAGKKLPALLRGMLFFLDLFLTLYAAFCLLWGANYYADDFCDRSGLSPEPVAYDDLLSVMRYFAENLSNASQNVPRDEAGLFSADRGEILSYTTAAYHCLYDEFPFLDQPSQTPKGIHFSKVMSALNFTGFYFPFTGESNVNMDSPAFLLASTAVHELSHQRGIASEQQCNFIAVLACTRCDNEIYNYAGWMLGYIHLANALYTVDTDAWQEIRSSLPDEVLADLRSNSAYWAQYRGVASKVSNSLNDAMIRSYGDALGTKSYGAVVDLLVQYFV